MERTHRLLMQLRLKRPPLVRMIILLQLVHGLRSGQLLCLLSVPSGRGWKEENHHARVYVDSGWVSLSPTSSSVAVQAARRNG